MKIYNENENGSDKNRMLDTNRFDIQIVITCELVSPLQIVKKKGGTKEDLEWMFLSLCERLTYEKSYRFVYVFAFRWAVPCCRQMILHPFSSLQSILIFLYDLLIVTVLWNIPLFSKGHTSGFSLTNAWKRPRIPRLALVFSACSASFECAHTGEKQGHLLVKICNLLVIFNYIHCIQYFYCYFVFKHKTFSTLPLSDWSSLHQIWFYRRCTAIFVDTVVLRFKR